MMHDEDLEATLRRYRPQDPSPQLRRRVLAAAITERAAEPLAWYWGPVTAAAILLLWLAIHTSRVEPEPDPIREAELAVVAEALGGGEEAIFYAELLVPRIPEPPMGIDPEGVQ